MLQNFTVILITLYCIIRHSSQQAIDITTVSRYMAQYDMAPEYNTDPSLVGISYDSESHLSDCGVSGGQ